MVYRPRRSWGLGFAASFERRHSTQQSQSSSDARRREGRLSLCRRGWRAAADSEKIHSGHLCVWILSRVSKVMKGDLPG
jgi:hypothetical protein